MSEPMSRREFLAAAAAGAAVAGATVAGAGTAGARKPNVVMMVVDGMRAEMLGCAGNAVLKTPAFDGVARGGVRFSHGFCHNGVCSPNRASLLTARYPGAHGVTANGIPLRHSEITLAGWLAQNGYRTGAAGKLHLDPQQLGEPRIDPGTSYFGFQEVHLAENVLGKEYLAFLDREFPSFTALARQRRPIPEEAHPIHWTVSRTLDFIRNASAGSAPFFAYCSFPELSPPDVPPLSFATTYRPEDMPRPVRREGELEGKPPHYRKIYENQLKMKRYPDNARLGEMFALYYAQMSFIDKQLARIVKLLEETGVRENTLIVLTADHGLCMGDHWIWRHGPWLYDQVWRVPLIINGPGIPSGQVSDDLAELVDVMPTILDCLGLPHPAGEQGRSLKPGRQGAALRKETVWADDREPSELKSNGVNPKGFFLTAVRSRDWKYVYYAGQPLGELYDLRNDPQEFRNLWNDAGYRRVRDEYRDRLVERLIDTRDPLPLRVAEW